jgi:hypothetical protein
VQYTATASCIRVVTATTDWMTPGCLNDVVNVGHGGALVAVKRYVAALGHYVYDVYDAKTGPAGGVLDSTSLPPALAAPGCGPRRGDALASTRRPAPSGHSRWATHVWMRSPRGRRA